MDPEGTRRNEEPRKGEISDDLPFRGSGKEHAQGEVDHLPGIRAEGPRGSESNRDRDGRLDHEGETPVEHQEILVLLHLAHPG